MAACSDPEKEPEIQELVSWEIESTYTGGLASAILDVVPRLVPSEVDSSEDGSLEAGENTDQSGNIDDTNSESEDNNEVRLEDLLNSSDTNAILDSLKIKTSPTKSTQSNISNEDLIQILDSSSSSESTILDEFPLYPNQIRTDQIIDDERLLSTPEKLGVRPFEGGSVSRRTRSSNNNSSITETTFTEEELSPVSQKLQVFQNAKSRIPQPVGQPPELIRRSKRLEQPVDKKRICSPKKVNAQALRSALRPKKSLSALNLIVDSSSGQLHEATKFATEINSINGEGVPIPQTATELVTIPVTGARKAAKNPKMAFVRGFPHRTPKITNKSGEIIGFYSEAQYKRYCSSPSKVVKRDSPKKVKKLRWANELEW